MKPCNFSYHAPATVQEALHLVSTLENAKFLAGGQTLMPMMNFRFAQPDHLIDLNTVSDLSGVELTENSIRIGAMTRQRDLQRSVVVQDVAPIIPESYALVSHPQIRNRGTLGGSLCHMDPASEQPCFLSAMGALLHIEGPAGRRSVPIESWALGYMTPDLAADEILVGIECERWPAGHGWCFTEYARRQGDYAVVGVAMLATADASQRVTRLSIAICGVSAGPVRMTEIEQAAIGRPMDGDLLREIQDAARAIDAMADAHVSADYRKHLAGVLTGRAAQVVFSRTNPSGKMS